MRSLSQTLGDEDEEQEEEDRRATHHAHHVRRGSRSSMASSHRGSSSGIIPITPEDIESIRQSASQSSPAAKSKIDMSLNHLFEEYTPPSPAHSGRTAVSGPPTPSKQAMRRRSSTSYSLLSSIAAAQSEERRGSETVPQILSQASAAPGSSVSGGAKRRAVL